MLQGMVCTPPLPQGWGPRWFTSSSTKLLQSKMKRLHEGAVTSVLLLTASRMTRADSTWSLMRTLSSSNSAAELPSEFSPKPDVRFPNLTAV